MLIVTGFVFYIHRVIITLFMNYDFALISNVNKDLQEFLENPTEEKNITLLFNPPPDNQSVYMCLVQRRYEGWLKSEYIDLYLQLGGYRMEWVNT